MEEKMIDLHVSAMYDSLNLINELNSKESLTNEEVDTVFRNEEHLKIMMEKQETLLYLSENQITDFEIYKKQENE